VVLLVATVPAERPASAGALDLAAAVNDGGQDGQMPDAVGVEDEGGWTNDSAW